MSTVTGRLGKRIASMRRAAGLSQEELAEMSSYSVDFIGLIERGINAPTVERLKDISDALGVELWELFVPQDKLSPPNARKKRRSAKK